jgi:ubiquinone biosynthesis protein COQ4
MKKLMSIAQSTASFCTMNNNTVNENVNDVFTKEFMERKIEISDFQRVLLAVGSSITSLLDPHRHDMIACLGETTGEEALKKIYERMMASSEGREILIDKPRINTKTIDMQALKNMPENSFGYAYWKFLDDNVNFEFKTKTKK